MQIVDVDNAGEAEIIVPLARDTKANEQMEHRRGSDEQFKGEVAAR